MVAQPIGKRLKYLLNTIADNESATVLSPEGAGAAGLPEMLTLWPTLEYRCGFPLPPAAVVDTDGLEALLLREVLSGRTINVFPTDREDGLQMSPGSFCELLNERRLARAMPPLVGMEAYRQLLRSSPPERLEFFVERVSDSFNLWLLEGDGPVLARGYGKTKLLPVWPAQVFAEHSATDEWDGSSPRMIALQDAVELVQDLGLDGLLVFPVAGGQSVAMSPAELAGLLEEEAASWAAAGLYDEKG